MQIRRTFHVGERESRKPDRSEQLIGTRKLRTVISQVLNEDKVRTGDLGGKASTKEYARALIRRAATA